MTKFLLSVALSLACCFSLASARSIVANPDKPLTMACHFRPYPITDDSQAPSLTPAPEGYEPFHMEHYGRHGSRWLGSMKNYNNPLAQFRKANKAGKLTPTGKKLYQQLIELADTANGHAGELTALGHRQHRDISRRMVQNFPEIFRKGAYVDAISTIVIRCILSMNNEMQQIERMVPGINVKFDASKSTMPMLNNTSTDTVSVEIFTQIEKTTLKDFDRIHYTDRSHFLNLIFSDPVWAEKHLKIRDLTAALYDIMVNCQSHHKGMYDISYIFSPEELRHEWEFRNMRWYMRGCHNPETKYRMPYINRELMANMVMSADTAITSTNPSANMRFGHDSVLLPLLTLMEIDDADYTAENLTDVASNWDSGYFVPMACNLQLIFYRPVNGKKGDILVKALLNEQEVTMPGKTKNFPYYNWSDLRKHYKKKLDEFPTRFADIEKSNGTFTTRNFID